MSSALPPRPRSWSFRAATLGVLAGPLLIIGTLAEPWLATLTPRDPKTERLAASAFARPNPNIESPARLGSGIAEALAVIVLCGLLIWSLIGLALFVARSRVARIVLVPLYAGAVALSAFILLHQFDPVTLVFAFSSGALLAYFLFSNELKSALR